MNDRLKRILKEWVIPYSALVVVLLLVFNFVFFLIFVPSGSMVPTIDEFSYIFATRVHNPQKNLERGDIVVFESDETGKTLVKRLIGLPGETVVLDNTGKVFIDGEELDEPYVKNRSKISGDFNVPEGCYFFLGDNRSNSLDARSWENPYIPAEKIEGKAQFTIWPVADFGTLE